MTQPVDSALRLYPYSDKLSRVLALAVWVMMLSACASQSQTRKPIPGQESAPWPGSAEFQNKFGDTIPEPLLRAMDNAYAVPEPFDCDTLVSEVQELESVLGEDLDSRAGAARWTRTF